MLYLDNAATTKVDEKVVDEMIKYFSKNYGNSNSKFYSLANESKNAIRLSKSRISSFLNCSTDDIYFNSGATEGNNTILKCVAMMLQTKGKHIISTEIEHSSILGSLKFLENMGYEVTYLKVDQTGSISLDEFKKSIRADTIIVSVMYVNNEIGTILPIENIGLICNDNNIFFHTDATQAVGKIPISFNSIKGLNALTFSGHKIYGPKGIGAILMKNSNSPFYQNYQPLVHGGEEKFSAGTPNIPGIVGIGKACEILDASIDENIKKISKLDEHLIQLLDKNYGDSIIFNNDFNCRIKGIINVRFRGINNEILLKNISSSVAASSGSACSNLKASHVLLAIGLTEKEARESIRFSLTHNLKKSDLEIFNEL